MPFPVGNRLEPSLYLLLFPRYSTSNVAQWMALVRPLNEGQGLSFWYQISHNTTSYRLSIVTFALERTV